MNIKPTHITLSLALLLICASTSCFAQATRTWVSGVGDDANPCSRTAPCKTFAGAISKTATGGEIDALDPAGYGAVTITKEITIDGGPGVSSVLVSGTNGIIVSAGASETVILRNLTINGLNTGLDGVKYQSGGNLIIDNLAINGFSQNAINATLSTDGRLTVKDTVINNSITGVSVNTSSGNIVATLDKVSINDTTTGILSQSGKTQIIDSVINGSTSYGIDAQAGTISLENSTLLNNGTALNVNSNAIIILSGNHLLDNTSVFGCGGKVFTSKTNRISGGSTNKCKGMSSITTR